MYIWVKRMLLLAVSERCFWHPLHSRYWGAIKGCASRQRLGPSELTHCWCDLLVCSKIESSRTAEAQSHIIYKHCRRWSVPTARCKWSINFPCILSSLDDLVSIIPMHRHRKPLKRREKPLSELIWQLRRTIFWLRTHQDFRPRGRRRSFQNSSQLQKQHQKHWSYAILDLIDRTIVLIGCI